MKVSKSSLVAAAAMTGLFSGAVARMNAEPAGGGGGQKSTKNTKSKGTKAKVDKHSCAGKNSCKGLGGCKTSDNGCKAKNSCKGKGGCATDGSHS